MAAAIFAIDLSLPLGVAGGVPYVAVVLVGWWFRRRVFIYSFAVIGTALTIAGFFFSPEGGIPWVVLTNRALAIFAIWVTAVLLDRANRALETEVAERELRRSHQRVRDFAKTTSDYFWETDEKFRLTFVSQESEGNSSDISKVTHGKTIWQLLGADPEENSAWTVHRADLLAHKPVRNYEFTHHGHNGRTIYRRWSGAPIFDEYAGFQGYRGTISDITPLREQEFMYSEFVENLTDGLVTIDEFGLIKLVNPAAEKIFHYQAGELIGENVKILMPEPDKSGHDQYLKNYIRTGDAKIIGIGREVQGQRKDGSMFPVDLTISEHIVGGQRRFTGILRDITIRRQAEQALRQQALILEQMSDGVVVTDIEGIIIDWNRAAERMYGYSRDEALGKTPAILHRPEDAESKLAEISESLRRDGQWSGEINFIRKDGTDGICETAVVPIYDEHGGQVAMMGVDRDVTERKKAEQALRQQALVLEQMSDGVIVTDIEGTIIEWNRAAEQIYGYSRDEAAGKTLEFLQLPKEADAKLAEIKESFWREGGWSGEFNFVRKDGTEGISETEISLLYDEYSGQVARIGVNRDVTERKKAEQALRQQALVIAHMTDGVIVTDLNRKIIGWNPAAERMYGYSKEEALGRTPDFLHDPEEVEPKSAEIIDTVLREGRWVSEINFLRKDGTGGIAETVVTPLYSDRHEMVARIGVNRDVTDRKAAEQVAQEMVEKRNQSQKLEALGNLARGIAHDFNNALFPIIGLTETTRMNLPDDSPEAKNLDIVRNSAQHASDLVRQILTFAHRETNELRPADLTRLVRDACMFLRAGLPENVQIIERIGDTENYILADPTQIHQVLVNLGINARDAMAGQDGTITISIFESVTKPGPGQPIADQDARPCVSVSVANTGTGMDADTVERIFEPFFTTKEEGAGTGLGLSVVHGIVNAHYGTIEVASEPGHGTTFTVHLPKLEVVQDT